MSGSDVDAVIAALRITLRDFEQQTHKTYFDSVAVNKWIGQLPGAWAGRWNRLKLPGTVAYRDAYLTHLRATIGYLEVNRDQIKARGRWVWSLRGTRPKAPPINAEFKEVQDVQEPPKKPKNAVRLIRGEG